MDQLIKGLACNNRVSVQVVSTTDLSNEAQKRHDTWPTASAALSRTMSMAAMMGAQLKHEAEKISIHINGGGELGSIYVDTNGVGDIRGFVGKPHVHYQYNDTGKLAVGVAVGNNGLLTVTKDLGLKEKFSGQVELRSGELGEDFAYYYAISEQIPSVVALGCLVDTDNSIISSGGILLQLLPDAKEEDIVKLEQLAIQLNNVSSMFKDKTPLEIAESLFDDFKLLETRDVRFNCHCSKSTMKRALLTLSKEERLKMIEEDHGAEIICHWCNESYQFSEQELVDLENFAEQFQR